MASAESELDTQTQFIQAENSAIQAEYEKALKRLEREKQLLNYLMKVKEGDEEALDFLIERAREKVSEIKKKRKTLEEQKRHQTPLTDQELELLEKTKKERKLTAYGESVLASVTDKHLNGERKSSDVEVGKDGCLIPLREQTCSGVQNTNDVQASGTEEISTQVSSAGSPPEREEPRSKYLDNDGVMPPEEVFTDSHRSTTSLTEESNGDAKVIVEELHDGTSEPGRNQIVQLDADIQDNKLVKKRNKKNEDKTEKVDKKKNEKKGNKMKKKDKKKMSDEKVVKGKSTKVRRGFLSSIFCCIRSQERDHKDVEKEIPTVPGKDGEIF